MSRLIVSFKELQVYQRSFEASLRIYRASASFPQSESYRLTNQILKSSTSVSANIAEAWRRRRYRGAFIDKLNISEAEAAETQHWLALAHRLGFLDAAAHEQLDDEYEHIQAQLVAMINRADDWVLPSR